MEKGTNAKLLRFTFRQFECGLLNGISNSFLPGPSTDYYTRNDQVKTGNDQVKGGNNDASKKKSPVAVEPISEKQDLQVCALHICAVAVLIV